MSYAGNDVIALSTGGVFSVTSAASVPDAPTLSVVVSGTTLTATIDGDVGATNYLKYKGNNASWQDGGSRSGDGDIVVTDLSTNVSYIFIAYSIISSIPSTPSVAVIVTIQSDSTAEICDSLEGTDSVFLDAFGESIVYKPAGGGEREIVAIVDRNPNINNAPHGISLAMSITIANNSTTGISSSEVDTGGDKVTLAVREGETAQDRLIKSITSQDCNMMTLEIR